MKEKWMDGRIDEEKMDGWTDGWRKNGRMDGKMDGWRASVHPSIRPSVGSKTPTYMGRPSGGPARRLITGPMSSEGSRTFEKFPPARRIGL